MLGVGAQKSFIEILDINGEGFAKLLEIAEFPMVGWVNADDGLAGRVFAMREAMNTHVTLEFSI